MKRMIIRIPCVFNAFDNMIDHEHLNQMYLDATYMIDFSRYYCYSEQAKEESMLENSVNQFILKLNAELNNVDIVHLIAIGYGGTIGFEIARQLASIKKVYLHCVSAPIPMQWVPLKEQKYENALRLLLIGQKIAELLEISFHFNLSKQAIKNMFNAQNLNEQVNYIFKTLRYSLKNANYSHYQFFKPKDCLWQFKNLVNQQLNYDNKLTAPVHVISYHRMLKEQSQEIFESLENSSIRCDWQIHFKNQGELVECDIFFNQQLKRNGLIEYPKISYRKYLDL